MGKYKLSIVVCYNGEYTSIWSLSLASRTELQEHLEFPE